MLIDASNLKTGQCGHIKQIRNSSCTHKLLEMNCLPGESIKLERSAPFGDPLVFNISGYLLSIRKSEASSIVVETE